MTPQPQQEDPADILYICSLEDLNCLHDYFMAAVNGDDLTAVPRLWNQEIGIIRSRPAPSSAAPYEDTAFKDSIIEQQEIHIKALNTKMAEMLEECKATIRNQTLDEVIAAVNATPPDCIQGEDIEQEYGDQHAWTLKSIKRVCNSLRHTEAQQ